MRQPHDSYTAGPGYRNRPIFQANTILRIERYSAGIGKNAKTGTRRLLFQNADAVAEKTESKTKLERPPLYKVLLHNDDFTPMEFVVFILQTIFNHGENDAIRLMLDVHRKGIGLAGVFTYEVAEMKVDKATSIAQANEFPLLCTMEEDDHQGT